VFLVDRPEQTHVGMAHWCKQAKHASSIATVVDMAMGAVVRVHFSFQFIVFKHFNFQNFKFQTFHLEISNFIFQL
jgi:hypothetical protein